MSYDIDIIEGKPPQRCDTCGHQPAPYRESFNITYNIRSQLDFVGIPFQSLQDLEGDVLTARAQTLVSRLESPIHRADLLALDPPNGWGSLGILQQVARGILKACLSCEHPTFRLS